MSKKIKELQRQLEREMSEEILHSTRAIRAKYALRKKEMEVLCEQETSHEWIAERLNDYNLSHLQRFGSTPQKCAYCYKPRPLEEYSDMIIKQESL